MWSIEKESAKGVKHKKTKCQEHQYCNLSLGLMTKARAYKSVGQEWSPKITFHDPRSVGECEGMNPHTPMWAFTLGVKVLTESQIFKGRLQGEKHIGLKSSLYHWKALIMWMFKMGLHYTFGYLKHKLWPKEKPRVKLPIWFPTTKSRESPRFACMQVMCHILLESSWKGYNFFLNLTLIKGPHKKLWASKVAGIPISGILRLPSWES